MNVLVEDYDFRSDKVFSLDLTTGRREARNDIEDRGIAGFGSERKIGFFKKRKIFVAIFPDNDSLTLWIDGTQFNLRDKSLSVKRKWLPFTYTYRISIADGSNILMSFWYTFVTFETWPDDRDIFTYISKMAADCRKSVEQIYYIMTAKLQGRNIENDPNFDKDMNDFVNRQLNQ